MQEHKYKHRHSHKKDGIDAFREQSLKAIQSAKVAYIVVFTIAIIMIALAFAAYFIDR